MEQLGLIDTDVHRCFYFPYHKTTKIPYIKSSLLTIYEAYHKKCKMTILGIYLKMQQQWKNPLRWREVEEKGEGS